MAIATLVYDDFEDGTTQGWSPQNPAVASVSNTDVAPFAGVRSLRAQRIASTSTVRAVRTLTGLVVGQEYTLHAACYRPPSGSVSGYMLGIEGISTPALNSPSAGTWRETTYTFTATATSHVVIYGALVLTSNLAIQLDEFRVTYEGEPPADEDTLLFGDKPVTQVFVGDKPVTQIYVGSTLAWP